MEKPTLKVLIVANNCNWPSLPEKLKELYTWFAPKVELVFHTKHVQFDNVPFANYPNNTNGVATMDGVDRTWYDKNIVPLALDGNKINQFDIVLLLMNVQQWKGRSARGWRTDRDQGPIELQVAADEKEGIWLRGTYVGSTFFNYSRHEIMHALFMMTGQYDTTHFWWDRWQLEMALAEVDFRFQEATLVLLAAYNFVRQFSTNVLNGKVPPLNGEVKPQPPKPEPEKPSKLIAWAEAIKRFEGWFPGSRSYRNNNPGNLRASKFAKGMDSGNYCIFKDYQTGFNALIYQLQLATYTTPDGARSRVYNPEMSLWKFFHIWAPPADNNVPDIYAANVAKMLGVSVETKIKNLV